MLYMGTLFQILLLFCLSVQLQTKGGRDDTPILAIKYGRLQGKTIKVKETDQAVHAFYGIPFAKPPVGPLRFAAPQPPEPWDSIRDATKYPPICLQNLLDSEKFKELLQSNAEIPPVSEDCLFLNIYTPVKRKLNFKLPVMVFIHGGGLVMGGASFYDGSALSAYENVVMVSIQYRLGILGFFSSGDEQARGNYGFLDQVAALQWIQENIEAFGGDPQTVTIFGESAGGVSVAAHVLSPLSKGLFHRAISESGVAIMPSLVTTKAEELIYFRNFIANSSGCDTDEVVGCLKRKTEEEILTIAKSMVMGAITACVDGVFLPKSAEQILIDKEINRVPFLIGVNNHEFGWILPLLMNISGLAEGMNIDTVESVLQNLPLLGFSSESFSIIMKEYFSDVEDPQEIRSRFLDIAGDIAFVVPAIKTAKYHRDSGLPVYFYEFQHRPSIFKDSKPAFVKADHADEIPSVLGSPFLTEETVFRLPATDEEKTLSRQVMKYWANFARNGDPNGPGLAHWPVYDQDEAYLEIDLKQKSAKKLIEKRVEFWTTTLPEKLKKLYDKKADRTEL
ncbi:fatty acyl-CoA hydrolase precursor, medium chain [Bombina bombina]|uniref:fatty acyl-CoA hydrolase precursor, medium chain n=1 Tax=Bombina bombina TaxID=8345 RepID=UPI00235AA954|nr:fatty acyl-CoA hydrolase precursor, medium chain [Bombina bombina]